MGRFIKPKKLKIVKGPTQCKLAGCYNCFQPIAKDVQNRRHHCSLICKTLDSYSTNRSCDCWFWNGPQYKGNPQVSWNKINFQAHKVIYHHFINPLLKGTHVKRTCKEPLCIRPEHLYSRVGRLTVREVMEILDLRYYMSGQKTADAYGISKESVRAISEDTLYKLNHIKSHGYV